MRADCRHRWVNATALLVALQACDAGFVDRRPGRGQGSDARPVADGTQIDVRGGDGRASAQEARPADAAGLQQGVFAEGPFEGRGGYTGEGQARLIRQASGIVLEFTEDFATSSVPGPVVVLSNRDALGTAIDPGAGDVELGTLQSVAGKQRYELAGSDEGKRYAWVYCKPFGVEVARALMEDLP